MFRLHNVQATEEFQEVQDPKVCRNSFLLPEDSFLCVSKVSFFQECGLVLGEPGDGGLRGPKGQCRFLTWSGRFWKLATSLWFVCLAVFFPHLSKVTLVWLVHRDQPERKAPKGPLVSLLIIVYDAAGKLKKWTSSFKRLWLNVPLEGDFSWEQSV